MSLDASLKVILGSNLTALADLSSANSRLDMSSIMLLTDGSGANQATKRWDDIRVVAGSATDSLDLSGGGLVDQFGNAFTITKLKMIVIMVSDTTVNVGGNQLLLTRPASNGVPFLSAPGNIPLDAGSPLAWGSPSAAGVTVTAGTGDLLNLVNSAATNSITYRISLFGA